jgi:hypothetical protein
MPAASSAIPPSNNQTFLSLPAIQRDERVEELRQRDGDPRQIRRFSQ